MSHRVKIPRFACAALPLKEEKTETLRNPRAVIFFKAATSIFTGLAKGDSMKKELQ